MSQILNKVRDIDPNNSDSVKEALSSFMQNLEKHTETNCTQWLKTLEDVINRFPKYCMSHRITIESHLVKYLDSRNNSVVILAAKCGHSLQQVRPSQEKAATPKSCWRDQMTLLCKSGHSLISAIFTNAVDIYKNGGYFEHSEDNETSSLKLPLASLLNEISEVNNVQKGGERHTILVNRLRNVFIFIQAMLVEIFPVAKPVRPQLILEVIIRALSVSSSSQYNHYTDDIVEIKTQALRCLDALVLCLGSNLVPFTPLIFKMVMQTLRWSNDNKIEKNSKVRCQAYSSLSRWLSVLHCHKPESNRRDARGKSWDEELLQFILDDITPAKHVVQLTMLSNQPNKNLSKKAKRKLANSMLHESAIATHIPGEKNKNTASDNVSNVVAIAALECAEVFINTCGIFLKPALYKLLVDRLVRGCYQQVSQQGGLLLPLCRVLDSTRKSPPSKVAPPTHICLHLYARLLHSNDFQVSQFCSSALLDIRLHLHCSPPSMNFVVETPIDNDANRDKKMTSERNRAVLESLIGIERMPPISNKETITIVDEPATKKPRLSEEKTAAIQDDQISVSSEDSSSDIEIVIDTDGNTDNNIDDIQVNETENIDKASNNETQYVNNKTNIFEAKTQMPLSQNDTADAINNSQLAEVTYDFPNTCPNNVKALERIEVDNIPSSNETDDIQINCGQLVKNSQEFKDVVDSHERANEKEMTANELSNDEAKINGHVVDVNIKSNVTVKLCDGKELTVDDMMADFVDEVNDSTVQS